MTTPFGRVYDHAVSLLPQLAARNNSPIHVWLTNHCDPELDIIPTITRLAEKNKQIGGFSYFTTAVMKARDERVKAEETFNPPAKVGFDDHDKAKRIAMATRKFGIRNSEHEWWLARYEAVHGRVEA